MKWIKQSNLISSGKNFAFLTWIDEHIYWQWRNAIWRRTSFNHTTLQENDRRWNPHKIHFISKICIQEYLKKWIINSWESQLISSISLFYWILVSLLIGLVLLYLVHPSSCDQAPKFPYLDRFSQTKFWIKHRIQTYTKMLRAMLGVS